MATLAENREQHIQRFHEQMEAWEKEMNRVRSMAYSANSYLQGEMNKLVAQIDKGLAQLTHKMVQLAEGGDKRVYTALEKMESAWGSLKSTISDVSERVRHRGSEAGEQIRDKVEGARDTIRDKAEDARDSLRDTMDQGMAQAKQAVNRGQQAARDTLEQGRELAEQGKEAVRNAADEARNATSGSGSGSGGRRSGQAEETTVSVTRTTGNPPRQQH